MPVLLLLLMGIDARVVVAADGYRCPCCCCCCLISRLNPAILNNMYQ